MVGIISHVAELKERIDRKIVVKKDRTGGGVEAGRGGVKAMRGCRSRNGSGNPGWFRGRVHPGPCKCPAFLAVPGGRDAGCVREGKEKG